MSGAGGLYARPGQPPEGFRHSVFFFFFCPHLIKVVPAGRNDFRGRKRGRQSREEATAWFRREMLRS